MKIGFIGLGKMGANMVKRLAQLKLVSYVRYHGFTVTPAGRRIAGRRELRASRA